MRHVAGAQQAVCIDHLTGNVHQQHIAAEARGERRLLIRLDDATYELIKNAALGDRRSIANYLEYAAVSFVAQHAHVSDEEMEKILHDTELSRTLEKGQTEHRAGRYRVVD